MARQTEGRYFSSRVRPDPNGPGWRGVLYYRDREGKTRERSRKLPGARTEAEAALACERWRRLLVEEEAAPIDPQADRSLTVGELVGRWVEGKRRTRAIERRTADDYDMSVRRLERGGLADLPVSELTYEAVQDWVSGMLDGTDGGAPLANTTVRKTLTMLKACTAEARRRHLIAEDPCEEVRPPKRTKKKQGINSLATPARRTLVSSLVAFEPSRTTCAAMVSLYTGLRVGEICGLQWGDLDDFSPLLWVRRSISVAAGGTYVKLAKTDRVRDVAMPDSLVSYLRRWRDRQAFEYAERGYSVGPETYIIGTPTGYTSPDVISHHWPVIARAVGVKGAAGRYPTFHDLRHTWITMYLAAGGDVMTAASNAGHASPSMTLDVYASADPAAKAASREITERAMMGDGGPGRPSTPGAPSAPAWFEAAEGGTKPGQTRQSQGDKPFLKVI